MIENTAIDKNSQFSYVLNIQTVKSVISVLFVCGWLLPKVQLGGVNLGIQELMAVLLLTIRVKINNNFSKFFLFDLFYAGLVFLLSIFHLLLIKDIGGVLIGARTLLFVLACYSFTSFEAVALSKILKTIVFIYLAFAVISVVRIVINIAFNSFDLMNFLYGSDSYRVRSPFENGGASSQVPIGYMLALASCIPLVFTSKFKTVSFIAGAIGTTSRAALISIVLVYFKRIKIKKIVNVVSLLFLLSLLAVVYLKSSSQGEGHLDGSANRRLDLYSSSIDLVFEKSTAAFIGFGISDQALADATGSGFYESFIINSLMQGGLILFIFSVFIMLKTCYYDYKYRIYGISIVVLLGNLIGGSNYFSMFAYPFMMIILITKIKGVDLLNVK